MLDSILTTGSAMTLDLPGFLACSAASLGLGVCVALLHMYRNAYSRSFVLALCVLPAIVQMTIMLVNGSIGTGVAVMGAFSLVRFRSAQGSAREIAALFLCMALGLATGMGYLLAGAVFLALVGGTLMALVRFGFGADKPRERMLKVTIPESLEYAGLLDDLLSLYTTRWSLERVKTVNMGSLFELCYRVTLRGAGVEKAFIDAIRCRNGNLTVACGRVSAVKEEL